MKEAYQVFDSSKIKEVILNGCIAAGITESFRQTCEKNENGVNLNLFSQREKQIILLIITLCSNYLSENCVLLLHK